jgi:hypothetical protein
MKAEKGWGMTQVAICLSSRCDVQSSNSYTAKKIKTRKYITYLGVPTHSTLLNPRVERRSTKN